MMLPPFPSNVDPRGERERELCRVWLAKVRSFWCDWSMTFFEGN
jgi:hypothetical protein